MNRVTFTEIRDRMTGQWQPCLEALGLPSSAFEKGNHPCAFCGGTDRANYGNRQRPETYYCRQCADRGLDGFSMLQEWHGWTAVEALQAVAGWLGMGYHDNVIPFTRARPRPLPAHPTKA